jgi:hypothetical protein
MVIRFAVICLRRHFPKGRLRRSGHSLRCHLAALSFGCAVISWSFPEGTATPQWSFASLSFSCAVIWLRRHFMVISRRDGYAAVVICFAVICLRRHFPKGRLRRSGHSLRCHLASLSFGCAVISWSFPVGTATPQWSFGQFDVF